MTSAPTVQHAAGNNDGDRGPPSPGDGVKARRNRVTGFSRSVDRLVAVNRRRCDGVNGADTGTLR